MMNDILIVIIHCKTRNLTQKNKYRRACLQEGYKVLHISTNLKMCITSYQTDVYVYIYVFIKPIAEMYLTY